MAKRRAEDPLLHDSPSKRCCLQLGSSAASPGGLSPPSLLALLGSRCRKRPHYFQDTDKQHEEGGGEDLYRKNTNCATITHAANNTQVQQTSSSSITSKKRPREDCTAPESAVHKAEDKADEDATTEDCTYNSFQYWRVPLPGLDLSLLEDARDESQTKDKSKVKDCSSDAMET